MTPFRLHWTIGQRISFLNRRKPQKMLYIHLRIWTRFYTWMIPLERRKY